MTLQMNTGAVRRFAKAMKFGAWLQSIPNKVTPVAFRLVQIDSAYWQSRALFVAVRLDVATVLGVGNLSTVELAGRVGANGDALGRHGPTAPAVPRPGARPLWGPWLLGSSGFCTGRRPDSHSAQLEG